MNNREELPRVTPLLFLRGDIGEAGQSQPRRLGWLAHVDAHTALARPVSTFTNTNK